jgi:hypothetical protein
VELRFRLRGPVGLLFGCVADVAEGMGSLFLRVALETVAWLFELLGAAEVGCVEQVGLGFGASCVWHVNADV